MSYEIETKLKVDSFEPLIERLTQAGAQYLEHRDQTDTYFDDAAHSLQAGDIGLRLRRQQTETETKAWLTYKGPRQPSAIKKRLELEAPLSGDTTIIKQILTELGYKKTMVVQKHRNVYHLCECEVSLDQVDGVGTFVEIEGPGSDIIAKVQRMLGLEHLKHISKSYAAMAAMHRDDSDPSLNKDKNNK